jgi:enterochelin esterase family protein
LHGSWDSDAEWQGIGRAGIILDNLLAERAAAPMLLVMPDGHPYPSFDVSTRPRNLALLSHELTGDLIPMVERLYAASHQRNGRAIAGCSMGGTQALHIGMANPGYFGSISAISALGDVPGSEPFEKTYAGMLKDASIANSHFRLIWLACGRDDSFRPQAAHVHELLAVAGIRHTWRETDGAHTWMVWRRHLHELLTLLFR